MASSAQTTHDMMNQVLAGRKVESNLTAPVGLLNTTIGKAPMKTVWKRAVSLKKDLAGDWINHLSVTAYCGLTSTNQINKPYHQRSQLVNQSPPAVS